MHLISIILELTAPLCEKFFFSFTHWILISPIHLVSLAPDVILAILVCRV